MISISKKKNEFNGVNTVFSYYKRCIFFLNQVCLGTKPETGLPWGARVFILK